MVPLRRARHDGVPTARARSRAASASVALASCCGQLCSLFLHFRRCSFSTAGAAAATAAASWVGSALVLGLLSRTVRWRPALPRTLADIRPLLAVSAALLVAQVTNSVTYSFTTLVASKAGTAAAAAHQISLQIWWLLSYFPVPLYLAAQSLLPRAAGAPRRGVVGVQARSHPYAPTRFQCHEPTTWRSTSTHSRRSASGALQHRRRARGDPRRSQRRDRPGLRRGLH